MRFMRVVLNNENGFTFIEELVSLVVLSFIAGSFIMSTVVGLKALEAAEERLTAESLARCQMELLKVVAYETVVTPGGVADYLRISLDAADLSAGYGIVSRGRGGIIYEGAGIAGVPWNNDETGTFGIFGTEWNNASPVDTGLQHFSLVVTRIRGGVSKEIFTVEGNKSNRDVTLAP